MTRKLRAVLAFVLGLAFILVSPRIPNPGGDLLHEIGFALVVAVVIWITFHVLSDADQEERWRRRIEQVTGTVFYPSRGASCPRNS
jgi:hypothetical protein